MELKETLERLILKANLSIVCFQILLNYVLRRVHFDAIEISDRCRAPTKNFLAPLDLLRIKKLKVDCNFVSFKGLLEILDRCPNLHTLLAQQQRATSRYLGKEVFAVPKEFFEKEQIRRLKWLDVGYTRIEITQDSIFALKATTLVLRDETLLEPADLDAVLEAWKTGKRPIKSWEISLASPMSVKNVCRRFDGKRHGREAVFTSAAGLRLRLSFDFAGYQHLRLTLLN